MTSTSAADHIFSLRVGTRSVRNYESKINTIKSFVQRGGYQEDGHEDLMLPISLDIIKNIFCCYKLIVLGRALESSVWLINDITALIHRTKFVWHSYQNSV